MVSDSVGQQCCSQSLFSNLQEVLGQISTVDFYRWVLQAKIKELEEDNQPVPHHMPKEVHVASFLLVFIPLLMVLTIGNYIWLICYRLSNGLLNLIVQARELGRLAYLLRYTRVKQTIPHFSTIVE